MKNIKKHIYSVYGTNWQESDLFVPFSLILKHPSNSVASKRLPVSIIDTVVLCIYCFLFPSVQ